MKRRSKRRAPLVADCSAERIAQLSNDLSEGIRSGTVEEWRAVALHFRRAHDKLHQSTQSLRVSLAGFGLGHEMLWHSQHQIARWLKDNPPQ